MHGGRRARSGERQHGMEERALVVLNAENRQNLESAADAPSLAIEQGRSDGARGGGQWDAGLRRVVNQLASFLSPSPRNNPRTGAPLASCSHPDCATSAARPRLSPRFCDCEGHSLAARHPLKRLHHAQRETGTCQREQHPDAAPNGPRLSRERCDLANRQAAIARTVGPPDETRHGQCASPWRAVRSQPGHVRETKSGPAHRNTQSLVHFTAVLFICGDSCHCQRTVRHSLFSSCIAIAAQMQFALTDSCPTARPGKERVGRRASNWRAING
jgi:hypothetical protein